LIFVSNSFKISFCITHKREKAEKVELSLFSRFGSAIKLTYTILKRKFFEDGLIGCHEKSGPPKFQWWYHKYLQKTIL